MADSKPVPVQIAFQSNPSKYSFSGNTHLINAYAEAQGQDAKAPLAVLPCPGLLLAGNVTDTPSRGNIFLNDLNCIYAVHSSGIYKVTPVTTTPLVLTATRIGTLPGIDQVQLSRNQASPPQISISCAAGQYYIQADVVQQVPVSDFVTQPVTSEYIAGYTVYGETSGKFDWSAINDATNVDALDFATAEQYADKLVRIKANGSDMFIFSEQSIEPWRVVGDVDLPFQLIGGAVSKIGCVAPLSVVSANNTLAFAGEDNRIYAMSGYSPQRISTHAVERLLENDTNRINAQGLSYTFEGHSFTTWSSTNYSVGYDFITQTWHERKSYQQPNWRFINPVRAWGRTIGGDTQTGNLYYLDGNTFTEGGAPMIWGIDTPFLHAFPNGGIVDALFIDVATGVGTVDAASQGFVPLLMLSWSTDGGKTKKGHRQLKLGAIGDTVRVSTRRLGRFGPLGIQFYLRISDPVIRSIVQMSANVRPLTK